MADIYESGFDFDLYRGDTLADLPQAEETTNATVTSPISSSVDPGTIAVGDLLSDQYYRSRKTSSTMILEPAENSYVRITRSTGTKLAEFGSIVEGSALAVYKAAGMTDPFTVYNSTGATTIGMILDGDGNMGVGTETFGTSAAKVVGIASGTAPASSPADMIQIFSTDISGNDATIGIRTEASVAVDTDETKFSHKLPVKINGSNYYIMLTTT